LNGREGKTLTAQGYNIIHWRKAGMDYWLISDLNLNELKQLAHLINR
jgi:anti-sigma factor RsiW